jgi:hypothetical protein
MRLWMWQGDPKQSKSGYSTLDCSSDNILHCENAIHLQADDRSQIYPNGPGA